MAGPVNTSCHAVLVELTELFMLDRPLPAPVARHLAGCEACAAEAEGVHRVVRTFERAESPLPVRDTSRPARSPLRAVSPHRPAGSRGRRRAAAVVTAVMLASCAVVALVSHEERTDAVAAQVTLSREGRMVERSWGTEVPVTLSGLSPGKTYRMMTADADGRTVPAGSLRAGEDPSSLHTRMMTAMPRQRITALLVQDEHGRMVARTKVTPPDSTGRPRPSTDRQTD
ncbi:hypothetical protein [Streptomyces sp. NPDC057694]|uniref:hypothetical protein n=1 Tax=Streptomyces sp. NPDC057694 TaxID=3346216 RepID=UPI0036755F3A